MLRESRGNDTIFLVVSSLITFCMVNRVSSLVYPISEIVIKRILEKVIPQFFIVISSLITIYTIYTVSNYTITILIFVGTVHNLNAWLVAVKYTILILLWKVQLLYLQGFPNFLLYNSQSFNYSLSSILVVHNLSILICFVILTYPYGLPIFFNWHMSSSIFVAHFQFHIIIEWRLNL